VTSIRRRQAAVAEPPDSARPEAARYVELAAGLVDTPPARLLLMHGFSGSGKTWHSGQLVAELPALRVRSDLERKRLPGLDASQRRVGEVDAGLYGADVTDRTYRRLAECCAIGLRAGFDMIADATFLRRVHRDHFLALAESIGAGFAIVDCSAPRDVLEARISARAAERKDASDADLAVLAHQLGHHDPLDDSELARVQEFPAASNSG
jgi:predicted kinase